jgi:hypothetical protein
LGYGGKKLNKTITVYTNDQQHATLTLSISGDVEKFVTVNPSRVSLKGMVGEKIHTAVSIVPEKKHLFKIVNSRVKQGQNISYSLNEKKYSDVSGYILTIDNLKTDKGVYHDIIYLETDSKIQPEIQINIYGNIFDSQKSTGKTGEL